MAIHIENTPSAQASLKTRLKQARLISLSITLLCLLLSAAILYFCVKLFETTPPAQLTHYIPPNDAPPSQQAPVTKQLQSRPASAASSIAPSIAVAATAGSIAMPQIDIATPEQDFGLGDALSAGFGNGSVGNDLGAGGYGMGSEQAGASSLAGTLYDLKQTQSGAPSIYAESQSNAEVVQLLADFYKSNWNASLLGRFWKSKTKLYTSCFYMPNSEDKEAPHAYRCSDTMSESRWVAIYKGKVKAPKTGRFRFVGIGDSVMAVRFNRKNVFQCGFHSLQDGTWETHRKQLFDRGEDTVTYPGIDYWCKLFQWNAGRAHIPMPEGMTTDIEVPTYRVVGTRKVKVPIYEDGPIDPGRERKIIGEREIEQPIHDGTQGGTATDTELLCRSLYALRLDTMEPNNLPGGFETGDTFQVKAGQWYDFEMLISEIGGGKFGFCLLIEDLDDTNPNRTEKGTPLYQLFRTNFVSPNAEEFYSAINFPVPDEERVDPPYDPDSLIWEAKN